MPDWQRTLARPIPYAKPKRGELRTLADARAFVLKLDRGVVLRKHWQKAAELMIEASEGRDVEAVTLQLELSLLLDGRLYLGEPKGRARPQ